MLVYPVSLIQPKNQTDQSNQSTLLYRKHGSCLLYYSLIAGEARHDAGGSSAPCYCHPPDGVTPALHPPR